MDELTSRLYETLQEHCRFVTTPVAVKLAKEGDVRRQKARYPVPNLAALSEARIPEKYHQIAPREDTAPEDR